MIVAKAAKQTKLDEKGQKKFSKVMREFHAGKLKSSSGEKVTDSKQAAAIGYSEARRRKKK